ncbi:MAG: hypothetical protein KA735_04175 [Burkholderiaceae bacterium]|nr:hypothetical protein [Burkholderiaceae bacterium]
MQLINQLPKRLLPALAMLALAGCTTMADLPAGTPLNEIQAKYGPPSTVCPTPDGEQHLIWSTQPNGQYAWGTTINAQGQTGPVVPILTDAHFRLLAQGTWTEDQVICEFGQPAEISTVGLPGSSQKVFSYRYRQSGAWNSLMYVYFDRYSGQVTRFHPGPDPMYDDRDRLGFFF